MESLVSVLSVPKRIFQEAKRVQRSSGTGVVFSMSEIPVERKRVSDMWTAAAVFAKFGARDGVLW